MALSEIYARESAARLNPIISVAGSSDTINQCSMLIDQLGHLMASEEMAGNMPSIHLFTGAISAALNFELEARHV